MPQTVLLLDDSRWWMALAVLVLTLSSGCSRIEILYRQADWLILRYIEDYVALTPSQDERLKTEISALLVWQCEQQFPVVSKTLARLRADVRQRRLNAATVKDYGDAIEGLWIQVVEKATPAAARLLADLDEHQEAELFQSMEERNREIFEAIRETPRQEVAADYAENARKQIRRWFGPLNRDQQDLINAWAQAFQPLALVGHDFRREQQSVLRSLVAKHHEDRTGMEAALRNLIDNMGQYQAEAYRTIVDGNRALTYNMVAADVAALTTPEQREHLGRFVTSVRKDLAEIACE